MLDGEIVVVGTSGRLDFFALQLRVHPAAVAVDRLAKETPASFIAFDLLLAMILRCRSVERRAALGGAGVDAAAARDAADATTRRSRVTGSSASRAPGWTA